ncbi:MAG: DUF1801 domain-containing protein [Mucilaginibacter polytrichastri]|nr:DUF1801 domain-containing protein [Mucilaginibacter polytrichastri]
MPQPKTTENDNSVSAYLAAINDAQKQADCSTLVEMISRETGFAPKMWGTGIVGFGSYHYKYESGHEGDAPLTGLAARSSAITLYVMFGLDDQDLLARLGKHKTGKGCLYIKKLSDVNGEALVQLIRQSVQKVQEMYPPAEKE